MLWPPLLAVGGEQGENRRERERGSVCIYLQLNADSASLLST